VPGWRSRRRGGWWPSARRGVQVASGPGPDSLDLHRPHRDRPPV